MGAAGRARAEEMFSWERIANRTKEIYESLV
jgi:glycosyltransferase involved in cell wall biosynthesis